MVLHNLAQTCQDKLDTVTLESLDNRAPLATWLENNPDPKPTTVPRNLVLDLVIYLLVDNPACLEEQVPHPSVLEFLAPPQDPVHPATWLVNNLDLSKLALALRNPDLNNPLLVDNPTCPEVLPLDDLELVALRLVNQPTAVRSATCLVNLAQTLPSVPTRACLDLPNFLPERTLPLTLATAA